MVGLNPVHGAGAKTVEVLAVFPAGFPAMGQLQVKLVTQGQHQELVKTPRRATLVQQDGNLSAAGGTESMSAAAPAQLLLLVRQAAARRVGAGNIDRAAALFDIGDLSVHIDDERRAVRHAHLRYQDAVKGRDFAVVIA